MVIAFISNFTMQTEAEEDDKIMSSNGYWLGSIQFQIIIIMKTIME